MAGDREITATFEILKRRIANAIAVPLASRDVRVRVWRGVFPLPSSFATRRSRRRRKGINILILEMLDRMVIYSCLKTLPLAQSSKVIVTCSNIFSEEYLNGCC